MSATASSANETAKQPEHERERTHPSAIIKKRMINASMAATADCIHDPHSHHISPTAFRVA